ncbi:MAG: type II toxin-antitoxin system RelB/DinJ family antitoxin [Eggerthellaceae bacterium]|nr:type II toxin-antitoxin system RelB/DinJ family antitoxin [Eggerthellaceae bacterium]
MTTTKATTIRLEEGLREKAAEVLKGIGISYNSYVSLATHQLINQQRIPFDCIADTSYIPNDETHRAIIEAEAKDLGLIKDDSPTFKNIDDAMAYLNEE